VWSYVHETANQKPQEKGENIENQRNCRLGSSVGGAAQVTFASLCFSSYSLL